MEKVQFQELQTGEAADIRVRWGYSGVENTDMTYGKAELTRHYGGDFSVEIILSLPKPRHDGQTVAGRDSDGLSA